MDNQDNSRARVSSDQVTSAWQLLEDEMIVSCTISGSLFTDNDMDCLLRWEAERCSRHTWLHNIVGFDQSPLGFDLFL